MIGHGGCDARNPTGFSRRRWNQCPRARWTCSSATAPPSVTSRCASTTWRRPTRRSCCSARPGRARAWSRGRFTSAAAGARRGSSTSIAARCRGRWPRASSSVTSAARSPARARDASRALRAGARRDDLPRRGRRAAARDSVEAPARPAGGPLRATGLAADAAHRRARHRGDQPRSSNDVRRGRFRQDLFYRLNVVPITLPPLARAVRRHPAPRAAHPRSSWAGRHGREFARIPPALIERSRRTTGRATCASSRTCWSAR